MKLVLHDTLATTTFVEPVRRGWVDATGEITWLESFDAELAPPDAFLLVPSPESTRLVHSHVVQPEIAVIDSESTAVAMRTPLRPDELSESLALLYETSGTAEVLARALIWPYFGITISGWTTEPVADAMISIVEGATALLTPDAGYSTDLGRAWFVMTGLPVVSHLLLSPVGSSIEEREAVIQFLRQSVDQASSRRRELRVALDDVHGIERERLVSYLGSQRYQLTDEDREALVALLVRGAGGSSYLPLTRLAYSDTTAVQTD